MLDESQLQRTAESLSPDSRTRLKTYVAEAKFFSDVLDHDWAGLAPGAQVIEIGSGIGLLSLYAAARGLTVTAYEPVSSGFSEVLNYREMILTSWTGPTPEVAWRDTELSAKSAPTAAGRAEFAFAINVVEHVPDIESLIASTMNSLRSGGRFRFICPNYAFPYEPHFEIPTLFHKTITYQVFRRKIRTSAMVDPLAMWDDLSWPNVWTLSRILRRMNLRYNFSKSATAFYLRRVGEDATFSARKGPTVRSLFSVGHSVAPTLLQFTPVSLLPVIDCTVYRNG